VRTLPLGLGNEPYGQGGIGILVVRKIKEKALSQEVKYLLAPN